MWFLGLGTAAAVAAVLAFAWRVRVPRTKVRKSASIAAMQRRIASRRREAADLAKAHMQRTNPADVNAAFDVRALRRALEMIRTVEVDPPDVAGFERLLVGNLARMAHDYRDEADVRSHGSGAIRQLGADLDRHWKERQSSFSDL
jgi:hypothetical protein